MTTLPSHIVPQVLAQFLKAVPLGGSSDWPTSTTIGRLKKEINQLEKLSEALQLDIRRRVVTLNRRLNQLTPIYRLPPELLAIIFQIVHTNTDQNGLYDTVKRLASVSSYWYWTVLSTPYLWTYIDSSYHPSFVKSVIHRSKRSPLHIHISPENPGQISERNKAQKAFLDLVTPHIARWKTCRSMSNNASRMLSLCQVHSSADILESYEAQIFPDTGAWPPALPTWLLRSAPRLRSLSVPHFSFPFGSQILTQLRVIDFSATVGLDAFTSSQWLSFLAAAPQLEVIRAKAYLLHEPDSAPSVPVHLSKLKSISLRAFSTSSSGRFLSCIIPAAGTHPSITIDEAHETGPGNTFGALFSGEPVAGSLLGMLRSIRWMTLKCLSEASGVSMVAGIQPEVPLLTVKRNSKYGRPTGMLAPLFSRFSPQLETLTMEGPPLFGPDFLQAMPSLRLLHTLTIIRPNWDRLLSFSFHDNLNDIIKALSGPQGGKPDGVWLLPKLRFFSIADLDAFNQGMNLTEDRYNVRMTFKGNQPVCLDTLRLSPSSDFKKQDTTEIIFELGPNKKDVVILGPEQLRTLSPSVSSRAKAEAVLGTIPIPAGGSNLGVSLYL